MATKISIPVFIVEDDSIFNKLLPYIFSKNIAYRFFEFKSGEECVRNLSANPRVIVIDYSLPGMNGYQSVLKIRKTLPHAHIITLLDVNEHEKVKDMLKAGADDYLVKDEQITENLTQKLEEVFTKGFVREEKPVHAFSYTSLGAVCFFILVILLVSAGFYYY